MEEDLESSDISAAQLAAIQNKGQFARSISLALSANTEEDELPVSNPVPKIDGGGSQSTGTTARWEVTDRSITMEDLEEHKDAVRRRKGGPEDVKKDEDGDDASDDSTGSSTSSNDVIDVAVGEIPLPQAASHRRHKTKQQKQRMRQLWMEFFEPFMGGSDTDESLALDTIEGADRPQRVPTLMELCMQKGFTRSSGPLPPGLKPMLSYHRDRARLAALQVRWLCQNMALLEVQIKWNTAEVLLSHGVKTTQLRRDARSLWRTDVESQWHSYINPPPEQHTEEGQWIMPVSLQTLESVDWKIAAIAHYLNLTLPHRYTDSNSNNSTKSEGKQCQDSVERDVKQIKRCLTKRYPNLVKHCFDLALAYVWWARGRCNRAQEAFLKVMQQYPTDREWKSQHSTLWARHKSMILVDIGRLLVTFSRPDSAGHFYREAVEIATGNNHPYKVSKLTLQSLALTASAYDQSVMDQHSAIQSARLWSATIQQAQSIEEPPYTRPLYQPQWNQPHQEKGPREAVLAAVESLLHCHAGHPTDLFNQSLASSSQRNVAWLREARVCLEKLRTERFAFVGIYLSLILAMLGEGVAVENAYNFYSMRVTQFGSYTTIPGFVAMAMSSDEIKPHPWWLFQEWVEKRTMALKSFARAPLRVLPLLWRRGLGHPSYCHDKSTNVSREQAAEVQGITPDLHVTPKGHLSGAMIQNLPPLRTICLDMRTGQVHFGDTCCDELHQWDNYEQNSRSHEKHRINNSTMLPQPNIIYTNPSMSTTVILFVNGIMINAYFISEATAEWIYRTKRCGIRNLENAEYIRRTIWPTLSAVFQSSSSSVKIDIVEHYLQERKKFILEKISEKDNFDEKYLTLAKEFIDYRTRRRLEVPLWVVKSFITEKFKEDKKLMQQTERHAGLSTIKSYSAKHCEDLYLTLANVMYVGKATVVLQLQTSKYDAFVFLDCTSSVTFSQQVVVRVRENGASYSWQRPVSASQNSQNQTANILMLYKGINETNPQRVQVHKHLIFGEKGNILTYEEKTQEAVHFSTCHGHKIIGTNVCKTRIIAHDFETGDDYWSSGMFHGITTLVVAQNTVYVLTEEGIYALDVNTLKPLVAIHLKEGPNASASNDSGLLLFISNATYLEVLSTYEVSITHNGAIQYDRMFLGFENHVLSLQRRKTDEGQLLEGKNSSDVIEVLDIMVPGKPTELVYISEKAGFVVSATVFKSKADSYYRENLYWFDTSGDLIAIHPFIGGGRHGFLPVYLKDPAQEDDDGIKEGDREGLGTCILQTDSVHCVVSS